MFEEVPRERRGVARLLPVRRIVVGPFVLGGGMLIVALGGSVAVAAAATVLTASAIGNDDLPPPRANPAPATSTHQPAPATRAPHQHRTITPPPALQSAASQSPAVGTPAATAVPGPAGVAQPSPAGTPTGTAGPTAAPSTSASPSPAPSSSGPLGNAVIHVSGYDQATGRLAYQFATVEPPTGGGGADRYVISDRQTFSATLSPTATITSGGSLCLPAGSSCTPDQVIRAADSGFFAEVAIDATGTLRSLIEVATEPAATKLLPLPSTSPGSGKVPGGNRLVHRSSSPTPTVPSAGS